MIKEELTEFFGLPLWLLAFGVVGGVLWGSGMSVDQVLTIAAYLGKPHGISAGGTFLTLYIVSVVTIYIVLYITLGAIKSFLPRALR